MYTELMNQFQKKIIVAEIIMGILFILLVSFDVLNKLPGSQCESFGCIANGIILLVIAVVAIPLFFGFVGALTVKKNRTYGGVFSFFSALAIMVLILVVVNIYNQTRIDNAVEDAAIQEQILIDRIENTKNN